MWRRRRRERLPAQTLPAHGSSLSAGAKKINRYVLPLVIIYLSCSELLGNVLARRRPPPRRRSNQHTHNTPPPPPPTRSAMAYKNLNQEELRDLLARLGLPTDGSKAVLVRRLEAFVHPPRDCRPASGRLSAEREAALRANGGVEHLRVYNDAIDSTERAECELQQKQESQRLATTDLAEAKAEYSRRVALQEDAETHVCVFEHPHRVRHNEHTCALLQILGRDDLRPLFMRAEVWGVVGLWRLRAVCRKFRDWAQQELSLLPRLAPVYGRAVGSEPSWYPRASFSGSSLDLSSMRWLPTGIKSLPDKRVFHSISATHAGSVLVSGGNEASDSGAPLPQHALLPGSHTWLSGSAMPQDRVGAVSVILPGRPPRCMVIGGCSCADGGPLASVLISIAESHWVWDDLLPMANARADAAAAVLLDGRVLVAGGQTDRRTPGGALNTAEMWDPTTGKWTALPPMTHARHSASACLMSGGRVAVVGGAVKSDVLTEPGDRSDGEVFDPATSCWTPLPADLTQHQAPQNNICGAICTAAVAGGMVAMQKNFSRSGRIGVQLYDEQSARWFVLPCNDLSLKAPFLRDVMAVTGLVAVPRSRIVGYSTHDLRQKFTVRDFWNMWTIRKRLKQAWEWSFVRPQPCTDDGYAKRRLHAMFIFVLVRLVQEGFSYPMEPFTDEGFKPLECVGRSFFLCCPVHETVYDGERAELAYAMFKLTLRASGRIVCDARPGRGMRGVTVRSLAERVQRCTRPPSIPASAPEGFRCKDVCMQEVMTVRTPLQIMGMFPILLPTPLQIMGMLPPQRNDGSCWLVQRVGRDDEKTWLPIADIDDFGAISELFSVPKDGCQDMRSLYKACDPPRFEL